MSSHSCQAIIVTCIDFRFQEFINKWISINLEVSDFDRVALAGGVFDWEVISGQIDISKRLHDIRKVVLVNHEDCGAYGEAGTINRHKNDLDKARKQVLEKYSDMLVECYIAKLNGDFEKVD